MNVETRVYKLLSNDSKLTELLASLRITKTKDNGIFKHDIAENFRKRETAPFIRINPISESDYSFSDDEAMAEEQRVQISFWTANDTQSMQIKQRIDEILKENNFLRYTANENPRYKDPGIDLLLNVRKYRFFDWEN